MSKRFKASRFNARVQSDDGTLIIYNSSSGAIAGLTGEEIPSIRKALTKGNISESSDLIDELALGNFVVPEDLDESALLKDIINTRISGGRRHLHLILLPTEECNFRCVYCFEFFKRGTMRQDVQDGVLKWLELNMHRFDSMYLEWFGGEPFHALDVVLSMGQEIKNITEKHGVRFTSAATTNGYYLDLPAMNRLLEIGCKTFVISIDGVKEEHDKRRILKDGGGTFDVITNNLKELKKSDLDFQIKFRHNFDPSSLERAEDFIEFISANFGGDDRFTDVNIRPIGRWGGPNDENISICEAKAGVNSKYALLEKALERGFHDQSVKSYLQPHGYVCYASDPNSYVIGADGQIMKCTLELDTDERNIVGQVKADGEFEIDKVKFDQWVLSGSDDATCHSCFMSPACQGAACAKERMDSGNRPCPDEKVSLKRSLPLVFQGELIHLPML